jgi:ABC-type transporter Mla subunit MlaD
MPVKPAPTRLGRDSIVGLAVIGAVAVIIVWGFLGKPKPFAGEHSVWAVFQNAATFAKFDREVRVGGANVGTVGAVQRHGDYALVQLNFATSVGTIHSDATAAIRPHTLFDGNSYIELWPGSPEASPLGNRPIPLSQTANYVSIDEALRFATAPTRHALQSAARNLSSSLRPPETSALRSSFGGAPQLFRQLEPAAVAFGGPTQTELAGSIRGFASTTSALARAQASYGPLLRATAATIRAFRTGNDAPLERSLAEFPTTLAAADSGGQALSRTIAHLEPVATALTPAVQELTPTLTQARPVLHKARPILSASVPFIATLRATLSAGQAAAQPATRLTRELGTTLKHIRASLLPLFDSRNNLGLPIYRALLSFASSAAGTLATVQTPAQSGNNGPGHLWHVFARTPAGSGLPCSAYNNAQLSALLLTLSLCVP